MGMGDPRSRDLPNECLTLTECHRSHGAQLHRASRDMATYCTRCSRTTIRIKWAYGRKNLLSGKKKERKLISQGNGTNYTEWSESLWTQQCQPEDEELGAAHTVGHSRGGCCVYVVQTTRGFWLQLKIQLSCPCWWLRLLQGFSKQGSLLWRLNPVN